jgi:prepilin-type N-terminal cleavage/methylation domain-containing protein
MIATHYHHGMTLVEVLAALALLSMLVAATSSLTGYISRVSAERQSAVTAQSALAAAADLIASDLDAWSAQHVSAADDDQAEDRLIVNAAGFELRFPNSEGRPARTIAYRFDSSTGKLSRSDALEQGSEPRTVLGDLDGFELRTDGQEASGRGQTFVVDLISRAAGNRSIAANLPPREQSSD